MNDDGTAFPPTSASHMEALGNLIIEMMEPNALVYASSTSSRPALANPDQWSPRATNLVAAVFLETPDKLIHV